MAAQRGPQSSRLSVVAVGAAALAAICCAGLPLLSAAVGGVTVAAVLGIGGVVVVAGVVAVAVTLVRARRRRGCDPREPE